MDNESFNLTTEPWIKVITLDDNQEQTVSLIDLFENAHRYRQLAGDMRSQDLAILRLLLAILTTVYSRFDAEGKLYDWLQTNEKAEVSIDMDEFDEDDSEDDLFKTWQNLSQAGQFSPVVTRYLKAHSDDFDFFGPRPFYQVTAEDYDALVPEAKRVAGGKGQVAIKQLNRQVSESGNTPAIFAPRAGETKNDLPLDELVRWIISYQNFTGVTDKSKVVTDEKFSNSAGWIYRINPVFAKGKTLFETLLLNLILVNDWQDEIAYTLPKPVWEYKSVRDYVSHREAQLLPDNLAELYTTWSRILHIEWDEAGAPHIFSAGIPIFDYEDALIEPMTTWRFDKKEHAYRPAVKGLRSLGIAMWRNFGQYVKARQSDDVHEPGIVVWLHKLKKRKLISRETPLILNSVALISDGVATSQSPAAEVVDDMQLQADVLFPSDDQNEPLKRWPMRIEDTIGLTQTIGTDYYHFASDIGTIRNLDVRPFASGMSAKFYEQLNDPFKEWLEGLTDQDNRDEKITLWKQELQGIVVASVNDVMQTSSPRDVKGISTKNGPLNIFTAKNHLMSSVWKHLDLKKE
ncbi:type I-E CRISPR-associated protein Cse1/CasA [Levilactobacillus huananensis]|uniref:type I-E CRISPR-associated protein Cse1/CasA n=1 Tax=Levilactobacillus huananensis TaxID=2486019 RepID=UPI000F7AF3AF|nr:type I-E CRISPR-associated protein Cse1/CasA [Levilactobacillus huananensis]